MTPEEQRIAIAKACGWHLVTPPDEDGTTAFAIRHTTETIIYPWHDTEIEAWQDCDDYLNDLNAMNKAEKVLTAGYQWCSYYFHLKKITAATANEGWLEHGTVTATAAQRAEAFLKTLNLWKE